jgi:hypothetical protein
MLTTNFHKDFTMTQRPLTAVELADARTAYNAIGMLYPATSAAIELCQASYFLTGLIGNRTTDGKPLRSERVPTKDDIGKRVKVRGWETQAWQRGSAFVGFSVERNFAVQMTDGTIGIWKHCIIDEEAAQ